MLHTVAPEGVPEHFNGRVRTFLLRACRRDLVPDTRWQVFVEIDERGTHVDEVYRKLERIVLGRYDVHAERRQTTRRLEATSCEFGHLFGARVVCCNIAYASCGGVVDVRVGEPLGTLGGRRTGKEQHSAWFVENNL